MPSKWTLLGITVVLVNIAFVKSKLVQGTGNEWTHELDLAESNGIQIRWKNSLPLGGGSQTRWLTMEVFAKTNGYVGVGWSSHGGMAGADIVIGWVDSDTGEAHLKDFHAEGNEKPIQDKSQDYELLSAFENENGTLIRFRRKWETCDEHDMAIVVST